MNAFPKIDLDKPKDLKKLSKKHKNNPDLNSFLAAKLRLESLKVMNNQDIAAKKYLYTKYSQKQDQLKARYKEFKKEGAELNELYNTICKIHTREYPFNYGIKKELSEKRKEIDKHLEK